MTQITPQPGIMDIALYEGGASKVDGLDTVIKLSSNENPLGPSPAAIAAYKAAAGELHRYPSTDHAGLRGAIAEVYGLDPERIICGAGSDEIIAFLCQAYVGPGDEVIHTEHGFAMYRISTLAAGGTPVEVPERERVTDVDAILAGVTDRTRLVFIANPNNPTGTMIGGNALARLADGLPEGCLLVLDGAYAEYVPDYDAGKALVESRENVVMTRTFSKIYGLGALRVGWGYGPRHVIDVLNRVRGPFNLSTGALAAAEAAVRDRAYTETCRAENAKWRGWLASELAALGIPSDTSSANFVLARFASPEEAGACDDFLKARGIIVRRVSGYKLPAALRMTVGDAEGCRALVDAVAAFKAQAA
ncbi:histidinol-phosphate aminotransferase [Dinoroseobacter shibae DFL 12 = DSM 16493]|jgi:histidinol-phosphate aminotransferase|uniref:Histidinol-phosphate aminotransferase n=1 Tax=Dinoroseobacter shibae (strain DSM 16493 / NCIMB 14021 / DFL 12) TaxID=398580 RepID=HIS8_DINSH|nr:MULTISPECIES: histidinol-phosphate transaminase [Dinoroseobacter]A8LK96.1 RecName: Full=Histidinol-phosphate aminotransferase; AltName: Full=Imidazole acetol-phosphate transaminase [Dinoroseobacter shibae DFL 12 = DSM 16493]ABV94679.1 histidinol-phosphate aminotransferase [Dinoroseobacter shibae DFL 12 = DSM 16493]MDD9716878.1 histidinol-phosphate transaminase [Dinoroseobacter sp. PD6]URF46102.1 histidinol-phosphate transaminase [Dinoroseobacter shibae]URF50409.1 histidinol-phosphate transa